MRSASARRPRAPPVARWWPAPRARRAARRRSDASYASTVATSSTVRPAGSAVAVTSSPAATVAATSDTTARPPIPGQRGDRADGQLSDVRRPEVAGDPFQHRLGQEPGEHLVVAAAQRRHHRVESKLPQPRYRRRIETRLDHRPHRGPRHGISRQRRPRQLVREDGRHPPRHGDQRRQLEPRRNGQHLDRREHVTEDRPPALCSSKRLTRPRSPWNGTDPASATRGWSPAGRLRRVTFPDVADRISVVLGGAAEPNSRTRGRPDRSSDRGRFQFALVVEPGVDPGTFRFSGGRSAD